LHFYEPVSVIDHGEDGLVGSQERLVLELEVFGQRQLRAYPGTDVTRWSL
jgi:hypothetical protein